MKNRRIHKKIGSYDRIIKGSPIHLHRWVYWPDWRRNGWGWSASGVWVRNAEQIERWRPRPPSKWRYPFNGWGHRIGMNGHLLLQNRNVN